MLPLLLVTDTLANDLLGSNKVVTPVTAGIAPNPRVTKKVRLQRSYRQSQAKDPRPSIVNDSFVPSSTKAGLRRTSLVVVIMDWINTPYTAMKWTNQDFD